MTVGETRGRVAAMFERVRGQRRGALMPFICGGYPPMGNAGAGVTGRLIETLERAGADAIEIGIPFSDPIADGPVIAAAMHEALVAGVTPRGVFEEVAAVRGRVSLPLIAMVSVSLVLGMGGPGRFVGEAKAAGFDGFIFPDVPLEESEELIAASREAGLTASLLVAPTTPEERAGRIAGACTGFVYLLARSGITGERQDAPEVESRVASLRRATRTPIACGFGISTAEHVRAVVKHADAAIVGSALVRRLGDAGRARESATEAAEAFVAELATGLYALR